MNLVTILSYACKFAFAGGMSVTKYIRYEVGSECTPVEIDLEAPVNFTAAVGAIGDSTVTISMQADDNSGSLPDWLCIFQPYNFRQFRRTNYANYRGPIPCNKL